MSPWPVDGGARGGPPAAPRPCGPRRRHSSTASPTCATCSSARARARPRRASPAAPSARRSCGRSASRSSRTCSPIGAVTRRAYPEPLELERFADVDASPVRCLDAEASRAMVEHIDVQRKANESLGGIFEVRAYGLVPGLGSHVSWEERLDGPPGRRALLDPGGQGRRPGGGLRARRPSPARTPTTRSSTRQQRGFYRETNHAGGLEGGMTNGEPLIVTAAMKPLPTLTKPLRSVDIATLEPAPGAARAHRLVHGAGGRRRRRGDGRVRARRRLPRKFGGDHIDDVRAAARGLPGRGSGERRTARSS